MSPSLMVRADPDGSDEAADSAGADSGDSGVGPSGPLRVPGQKGRRMTSTLSSLREYCRRLNACISRQGRDRVKGRFYGQQVAEWMKRVTEEEQDYLSDEDYVAVLEEDTPRPHMVRIAMVENLVRITTGVSGKRDVRPTPRLARGDPTGEMALRMLTPDGKGRCHGVLMKQRRPCFGSRSLVHLARALHVGNVRMDMTEHPRPIHHRMAAGCTRCRLC